MPTDRTPRAIAAPEQFLFSGLGRWMRRHAGAPPARAKAPSLGVELPRELDRFLAIVAGRRVGDFAPRAGTSSFGALLAGARRPGPGRARLASLLASAVPFGGSKAGEIWIHFLGDPESPARGVVAAVAPAAPAAPRLTCRGMGAFALMCTLHGSEGSAPLDVAEHEAARAACERASAVLDLVVGGDARIRRAARTLAPRPLDVPPPATRRTPPGGVRPALALGAIVEAFFLRDDAAAILEAHMRSRDAVVASAAELLGAALVQPRSAAGKDLARRRGIATRAAAQLERPATTGGLDLTRLLVAQIDGARGTCEPLAPNDAREEALLALAEHGDRTVVPALVARAITGDASAVEMLGALGDPHAVPHLASSLRREPTHSRHHEAAVVRALGALGAKGSAPELRARLADNPMPSWREGIERGPLVRELVSALGELRDESAGPALAEVLDAKSQEYRAVLPAAALALGRIAHLPALATLERLLGSVKEPVTCEAIWAVGAIARRHRSGRARATSLLEGLKNLEPGAEMVRLTALSKLDSGVRAADLRRALERALWEPAFRQEETSRRRSWTLASLGELASLGRRELSDALFVGHEVVRYFVTRDDHRVRRAAERAFAAAGVPVPPTRRYYSVVVHELERRGRLDALHEAVRDRLGVFRHNVATRLAELGDPASIRPLAEATARLFAEPPTSTYEYDDAPAHLVAFVRALSKLNRAEGNDVLIEGLRSGHHQVRAVVAENAPEDERFVPELMAMLGDPRSFLRSRAERSLAQLGVQCHQSDAPPPHPTRTSRPAQV